LADPFAAAQMIPTLKEEPRMKSTLRRHRIGIGSTGLVLCR
jgi:hypothetical protein